MTTKSDNYLDNKDIITEESSKNFDLILSRISQDSFDIIESIYNEIILEKPNYNNKDISHSILDNVENKFNDKTYELSQEQKINLRYALVANFALNLPYLIKSLELTDSILKLYPVAIEKLSFFLEQMEFENYDISNDFFRKDINLTLGLHVPCGGQVLELSRYFRIVSVLRSIFRGGNINPAIKYFLSDGPGQWFSVHTESRYLDYFSEEGWDACYIRIAEMLLNNPSINGLIGTSWFYDPSLIEISPHLRYLRERPLQNGAFMMKHGSTPIDIERATIKSKKRRKLYEEGKYLPVSYTIFWPRKALIAWAKGITGNDFCKKND